MNAFLAIMLESYRELNSRKLFWITMILSGLVVLIFFGITIGEEKVSVLGLGLPIPPDSIEPEAFFKDVFITWGIGFWLAWIASIIALATTADIFPSLMGHGSIDMVLSKPIRRVSLFAMKFVGGLLFMALQVTVFCTGCFLLIGFKSGAWEPGIFLAVPVTVLVFSYLFAICVFFGVLTRSTIASLLLTLLVWFVIWLANTADGSLVMFEALNQQRVTSLDARVERQEEFVAGREARAAANPTDESLAEGLEQSRRILEQLQTEQASATDTVESLAFWSDVVFKVKTVLPKTGETVELLKRWLIDAADLESSGADDEELADAAGPTDGESVGANVDDAPFGGFQPDNEQLQSQIRSAYRERSVWWIIGTSLLLEFLLLGFAAWRFQRRDF